MNHKVRKEVDLLMRSPEQINKEQINKLLRRSPEG